MTEQMTETGIEAWRLLHELCDVSTTVFVCPISSQTHDILGKGLRR